MLKTKYTKTTRARPPGVKSDPSGRGGEIEILEKLLSLTAQNHYADLQQTCDKVTKVCVIVRYTKKVIEKKRRLGSNLTPGAFWGLTWYFQNYFLILKWRFICNFLALLTAVKSGHAVSSYIDNGTGICVLTLAAWIWHIGNNTNLFTVLVPSLPS